MLMTGKAQPSLETVRPNETWEIRNAEGGGDCRFPSSHVITTGELMVWDSVVHDVNGISSKLTYSSLRGDRQRSFKALNMSRPAGTKRWVSNSSV